MPKGMPKGYKTGKAKKRIDIELIRSLIDKAGVTIYLIEKELSIPNKTLGKALAIPIRRDLPEKWEAPIIKYLKEKIILIEEDIQSKMDDLKEAGIEVPKKVSNLSQAEIVAKLDWVQKVREVQNVDEA